MKHSSFCCCCCCCRHLFRFMSRAYLSRASQTHARQNQIEEAHFRKRKMNKYGKSEALTDVKMPSARVRGRGRERERTISFCLMPSARHYGLRPPCDRRQHLRLALMAHRFFFSRFYLLLLFLLDIRMPHTQTAANDMLQSRVIGTELNRMSGTPHKQTKFNLLKSARRTVRTIFTPTTLRRSNGKTQ